MKVLYISDSLGTPIHPRGIFNFSISLVEILKSAGASVDLVVEGAGDFSLEDRFGGLVESRARCGQLGAAFRDPPLFQPGAASASAGAIAPRAIRFLAKRSRAADRRVAAPSRAHGYRPNIPVRNDLAQIDFVPAKSEHLNLFDNLVVKRGFYSSSMSRANLGLPPPSIDASGYDLAIVDTPHFIKRRGHRAPTASSRSFTTSFRCAIQRWTRNWRNLFMRKLDATLALGRQYGVRLALHAAGVPRRVSAPRRAARIHLSSRDPPQADERRRRVAEPSAPERCRTVDAARRRRRQPRRRRTQTGQSKEERQAPSRRRHPCRRTTIPSLPYFVTATSDEPRKNIAAVVTRVPPASSAAARTW